MSVATLANRSFTIQRPSETVDASGGTKPTFSNVLRVRGRCQPASANDQVIHGQQESRVSHVMYTSGTPDIREGDRLATLYDRKRLYVIGVMDVDLAGQYTKVLLEGRAR